MPSTQLSVEQTVQVKEVVNRVLESWVGYQLALKNNAAGGRTLQLDQMLHEELQLLLIEHASIERYDLEDWLDDAFDEHFNLRLEDGSISEMSQILFDCLSLILKHTPAGVPAILDRLPSSAQTSAKTAQCSLKLDSEDESGAEEDVI